MGTQGIFLQMYKQKLAYQDMIDVNGCEELGTVLANEEVELNKDNNLVSERGKYLVIKKPMKQWVLKITNYGDKLLDGLNSNELNGPDSLKKIQTKGIGKTVDKNGNVGGHMHDGIFSRQRYWGEPFPIAFNKKDKSVYLINDLPVLLPDLKEIKPGKDGQSPLCNAKEWLTFRIDDQEYERETNTMPQGAGSSWYFLAYLLKKPNNSYVPLNSKEAYKKFKRGMPVDLYIGGQEHAASHLLYSRFGNRFLYDIGITPISEPFKKIVNQGMILGPDGEKMSKSRGNVINPDEIIVSHGADSLRLYLMFMGPITASLQGNKTGLNGIRKWLDRVYNLLTTKVIEDTFEPTNDFLSIYHKFVCNVTKLIDSLSFNLAISEMMVFINECYKQKKLNKKIMINFLIILSCFAPFISEYLYKTIEQTKKTISIMDLEGPKYDEKYLVENNVIIPVQINGKHRANLSVDIGLDEQAVIKLAKQNKNVAKFLDDKKIVKIIFIPDKLINFVIK